jgi:hypothetical protein
VPNTTKPEVRELDVSVVRNVWTEGQRGQWEVRARVVAYPDSSGTTGQNLDRIYGLLLARCKAWTLGLLREDEAANRK